MQPQPTSSTQGGSAAGSTAGGGNTYPLLTNADGYSRDDEEYFSKLKPKSFIGDLDENHFFYFSDVIDIMMKEKDLNRKYYRMKVFLHGSKEKKERPFFQLGEDILEAWTSPMGFTSFGRTYLGVQAFGTGLKHDLQKLVEFGFVNHLLILMTHGYRFQYEKKYINRSSNPPPKKDDVSVDHFLYEPRNFQDSCEFYPQHAAECLMLIIKHSDWNTFLAIMERYFSSKQNGPRSSKLINDGRHTIMNGVGVFWKVLKYGLAGMKEIILVILKTIHARCKTLQKNILYNTNYPLIESLFDSLDTMEPEKVIKEFSSYPGKSQLRLFEDCDLRTAKGKSRIVLWSETLRNSTVDVIGIFIHEAKKGGNRKMYLDPKFIFPWSEEELKNKPDREHYNKLVFRLCELIDSVPLSDFQVLEYYYWLPCIFSNLLFEKDVCDSSKSTLEQVFEIDYELLDFISGEDQLLNKLCNSLKRLYHDPMFKLSNFMETARKFVITQDGSDSRIIAAQPKIRHIFETIELALLDLLSWLSYNSLIAYKFVQYDNHLMLVDLIHQSETNLKEYYDIDALQQPALACHCILDEEDGYYSMGRDVCKFSIVSNMSIAAPDLNKVPYVHDLLLRAVVGNKEMINNSFVSLLKNYKVAAHAYKSLFRVLSDLLEEFVGKPDVDQQRAVLASNIGEMCLRIERHDLAELYLKYSLKIDPDNDKTKRRLDRVKK